VFVPDPHTEFRAEALRQAVTADLDRSKDRFVFGDIQALKLEALIVTGEAVPVQHIKIEPRKCDCSFVVRCLRTEGGAVCSPETLNSLHL
jgi:hypothetical protein